MEESWKLETLSIVKAMAIIQMTTDEDPTCKTTVEERMNVGVLQRSNLEGWQVDCM